jgi:hypothetical protein
MVSRHTFPKPLPWRRCVAATRYARRSVLSSVCALAVGACGGGVTSPIAAGTSLSLTTSALPTLDAAREGLYVVWFADASGGLHLGGTLNPGTASFASPIADPAGVAISIERTSTPSEPSGQILLRGALSGGRGSLSIVGAITQNGVELRQHPGQFTMFTPSDNDVNGYPSHEESGVWLFNVQASTTEQNDFYVRLAQLQAGWTYEGWMVRDYGTAQAIWLSYGKFIPDWTGAVNKPDDTGWGPFSGVTDYTNSRLEDFPGDDFISNPLHLPFPAQLTLPLNFRERDGTGRLRWTHLVSIEPATDAGEPVGSERPFFLRPYVDMFGDLNPGVPRVITLRADAVPSAVVEVR